MTDSHKDTNSLRLDKQVTRLYVKCIKSTVNLQVYAYKYRKLFERFRHCRRHQLHKHL